MENLQVLPDDVLRKQVCHECLQYLSIPPIVINRQGETICGRCCDSDSKRQNTKSLYNTVAEGILFKCRNHLSGCTESLTFAKVEEHEKKCHYESQECFFCSYSGNLCQILQHSMKIHNDNISFDGIVSFSLQDKDLHKQLLYISIDSIFFVNIKISYEFFIITIRSVTKPLPSRINQFGLKFFKSEDPSNFEMVHIDYSLLNSNFESYFKKSKEELANAFGPGIKLFCHILVDSFVLEAKEAEFQKRYARLRHDEEELRIFKGKIASREQKLSHQSETYEAAMNIIKIMSHNLFKCSVCMKTSPNAMFFCSKIHCCCKDCLTNICRVCNSLSVFKRLKDVETFVVACDWHGCQENLELKHYFQHMTECPRRQFKCPLQNCNEIILSAGKLIEHWHVEIPRIFNGDSITFEKYDCEELFWLLKNNLYRVSVVFDANKVEVLIEEINVLPNGIKFKCEGYVPDCFDGACWHNLNSSEFCGKFQINIANSLSVKKSNEEDANEKITQLKFLCN